MKYLLLHLAIVFFFITGCDLKSDDLNSTLAEKYISLLEKEGLLDTIITLQSDVENLSKEDWESLLEIGRDFKQKKIENIQELEFQKATIAEYQTKLDQASSAEERKRITTYYCLKYDFFYCDDDKLREEALNN